MRSHDDVAEKLQQEVSCQAMESMTGVHRAAAVAALSLQSVEQPVDGTDQVFSKRIEITHQIHIRKF